MAVETLRTAWIGLMSHRLRTALTVLGITIGIASVIVLIAVGKGSSDAVQESIDALGSNTVTVSASPSAATASGTPVALTLEKADAEALEDPNGRPRSRASRRSSTPAGPTRYGSATAEPGELAGPRRPSSPPTTTRSNRVRCFTASQVKERARVAVIGPEVASELFPGAERGRQDGADRPGSTSR